MSEGQELAGPDLATGIEEGQVAEGGMVVGHAGGEAVLLTRVEGQLFAIGATCTHYGAPLADGRLHGGVVRCPWHHARFDVRTGEALAAPALSALPCWRVERREGKLFVLGKISTARSAAIKR